MCVITGDLYPLKFRPVFRLYKIFLSHLHFPSLLLLGFTLLVLSNSSFANAVDIVIEEDLSPLIELSARWTLYFYGEKVRSLKKGTEIKYDCHAEISLCLLG